MLLFYSTWPRPKGLKDLHRSVHCSVTLPGLCWLLPQCVNAGLCSWWAFSLLVAFLFLSTLALSHLFSCYTNSYILQPGVTSLHSLLSSHFFPPFHHLSFFSFSSPLYIWSCISGPPLLFHVSTVRSPDISFFPAPMSWLLQKGCHGNGLLPGTHPWRQPEWGVWQLCPGLFPREEDFGGTRLLNRYVSVWSTVKIYCFYRKYCFCHEKTLKLCELILNASNTFSETL